ncbi:MAG: Ig-like domain-containing protein [Oligoflexales bacterium]
MENSSIHKLYGSLVFCGFISFFSLSCGSTGFKGSNIKEQNAALAEGQKLESPENIEAPENTQDGEEEIIAERPAVISGAYLSCQYGQEQSEAEAGERISCRLDSNHLAGQTLEKGQSIEIDGKIFKLGSVWEENGSTLFVLEIEEDTLAKLETVVEKIEGAAPRSNSIVDQSLADPTSEKDLLTQKNTGEVKPNFIAPTQLSLKLIKNESIQLQLTGGLDSGMPIVFQLKQMPLSGSISGFDPSTGMLTYTPLTNFVGADSFSFVILDGLVESQEFYMVVEVLEFMMLSDDFERLNPIEDFWIQSEAWGNGLRIFDRDTPQQNSLFLFGNGQDSSFVDIRMMSKFLDFSGFSTAKLSALYLLQDVGDDATGADLSQETMNIKICVKSSAAECGLDPRNETLFNDDSLWISIFTPQQSELNNNQRDCKDMNWSNLDLDLDFGNLESTYPGFSRNKVSIMLEAASMQAGMETIGDLSKLCNDVLIFDQLRFQGTNLK